MSRSRIRYGVLFLPLLAGGAVIAACDDDVGPFVDPADASHDVRVIDGSSGGFDSTVTPRDTGTADTFRPDARVPDAAPDAPVGDGGLPDSGPDAEVDSGFDAGPSLC